MVLPWMKLPDSTCGHVARLENHSAGRALDSVSRALQRLRLTSVSITVSNKTGAMLSGSCLRVARRAILRGGHAVDDHTNRIMAANPMDLAVKVLTSSQAPTALGRTVAR